MKYSCITLILCLCTILALASPVPSGAQKSEIVDSQGQGGKLIEFDAPNAGTAPGLGTVAFANNNLGVIVGYYTDANIVPHGFLRTVAGKIISFDAPGAGLQAGADQGTVAYSINDLGVIAGQFEDPNNIFHGFVRYSNGNFVTFDSPGAGTTANQGTLPIDINLSGGVAGVFLDGNYFEHGFVRLPNGKITSFEAPDASPASFGTQVCEETCLNNQGAITGEYYDANNASHGFVRQADGKITEFDAPGAGTGTYQGTIGASINDEGTITGYFLDSNNVAHGFVRTSDGKFTTFDDPKASTNPGEGTAAFSINLTGAVTGEFLDANSVMHGFSRSSSGSFVNFDAPHAGIFSGQGTRPSTNNQLGAVAGWYVDGNDLSHGFVWCP